ncbi:MAG TPA: allantoate amidohydrolase [Acidimicrobiia bacterium]|nr:allantoate amidohydrolase [Acidimicrobiia bacterium]
MRATDLLAQIETIGREPTTNGYRRFSWTAADAELRHWFGLQATTRGLSLEVDGNGNLWAYRGDPAPDKVVAVGSHLDSVPDGGQFDGPLGVASAFAALDLMDAQGVDPRRPVAVVGFVEEEGARFGVACLGSRLAAGLIQPATAATLSDGEGITWAEAMVKAGLDAGSIGSEPTRLGQLHCFVELHIEQGRALEPAGAAVGIGTEIWPHGRWRFVFEGESNHAGTTSMEDRNDPMPILAETVLKVTKEARRIGARATFGRLLVEPNGINSIPSRVTGWLDARAPNQELLDEVAGSLSSRPGITVAMQSSSPAVHFDKGLLASVEKALPSLPHIPTAAGHDAGILAGAAIPTTMLFVRNRSGISHSPREHADPADIDAGVEALASLIAHLAGT